MITKWEGERRWGDVCYVTPSDPPPPPPPGEVILHRWKEERRKGRSLYRAAVVCNIFIASRRVAF
jgi:hypothetical protein